MSKLSTLFYLKNLPAWERAPRITAAAAFALYAALAMSSPWRWLGLSSAITPSRRRHSPCARSGLS